MLEEKAAKYFENEWVWEKELRQLQEQEETAMDAEVKRGLQYMIQVKVEALKLHFKQDDLPGLSKLLVAERTKPAMDMKWLSSQQAQRVYGGLCLICLMGTNLMSKTFSSRLSHRDRCQGVRAASLCRHAIPTNGQPRQVLPFQRREE